MKTSTIFGSVEGVIRRRILLNYAADPDVAARQLPEPFRPRLYKGHAVVGVCLIRLEDMKPGWFPVNAGFSSDNAAHRIAVEWTDENDHLREGVFITRRDTESCLNEIIGGRLFPGEYSRARFKVTDADEVIYFSMRSVDGSACIDLKARAAQALPQDSMFETLDETSQFFESGCDGFSPRSRNEGIDGMRLCVDQWKVKPLAVEEVHSSWLENEANFPKGSVRLDHALIMRDVPHQWKPITAPAALTGAALHQ